MTVDEKLYYETESLILPTAPIFYPAKIPVQHWQLRHLISSPFEGVLYYASDSDIYSLDTSTRKRQLITSVPFEIRCLAADHGWLCVGGSSNGQFAAVRIGREARGAGDRSSGRHHADVDALLPLDLDPEVRRQTHRFLSDPDENLGRSQTRRAEVWFKEFGGDITNSVTIHRSPDAKEALSDGVVAVLTNNDKTVRIFSLTKSRLVATLDYPCMMNHATISPNGKILVAVGDERFAYFHTRVQSTDPSDRLDVHASSPYTWQPYEEYRLSPAVDPRNNGCFSTAFSSSGESCAVASQDGLVSVFSIQSIDDREEDPLVELLPSTRPHYSHSGAVRSVCFSPEPWDLLICAEHCGRVFVTDTRSGFKSRQIIKLENGPDVVNRVEVVNDTSTEETIDPRLRDSNDSEFLRQYRHAIAEEDETTATNFAADYIEASADRRRLQRQARDESPQPFTEHERQILDALRTSRERVEARENRPISINYRAAGLEAPEIASLMTADEYLGIPSSTGGGNPSIFATSSNRERTLDGHRTRSRAYEPRRRSSVILSQNDPPSTSAVRELPDPGSTVSLRRLHTQNAQAQGDGQDPWQTIEAAMASEMHIDAMTRIRREREAALEGSFHRRQQSYLRQDQRRRERLRNLYAEVDGMGRYDSTPPRTLEGNDELGTTGCAMSQDGRKL
ncbi:MAG: hypothetical protein M1833_003987 [Piccolia ochrophora]|nr:MAG: hypothetical protein M1833_003987 [Piccolia ochrophora]